MKLSSGKFLTEMEKIENMLVNNLEAEGSNLSAKVVSVEKQVPKGVYEKLTFLAGLYDRLEKGEKADPADLKQAGFWIDAVWPYVSNGLERGPHWGSRIIWIALAVFVVLLAFRFLR